MKSMKTDLIVALLPFHDEDRFLELSGKKVEKRCVRFKVHPQHHNLTFGNNFNQTLTFEFLLLIHSGVPATSQQGHHQSKAYLKSSLPMF